MGRTGSLCLLARSVHSLEVSLVWRENFGVRAGVSSNVSSSNAYEVRLQVHPWQAHEFGLRCWLVTLLTRVRSGSTPDGYTVAPDQTGGHVRHRPHFTCRVVDELPPNFSHHQLHISRKFTDIQNTPLLPLTPLYHRLLPPTRPTLLDTPRGRNVKLVAPPRGFSVEA